MTPYFLELKIICKDCRKSLTVETGITPNLLIVETCDCQEDDNESYNRGYDDGFGDAR